MTEKTVVIWDTVEAQIKFFVVDGDHRPLNGVYINDTNASNEQIDSLTSIVYNAEFYEKVKLLDEFPTDEVQHGAYVIVAGFLP